MATRPAHIAGTISHAGNPSTASDLSSSSQEDKPEETSKQALEALIEEILIFEDNGLMPVTGSMRYLLQLVVNSQIMQVRLGTRQAISVKNDGGVCVTRQGSFTGSDRYDIVPVLSLEVSFSIHLTSLDSWSAEQTYSLSGQKAKRRRDPSTQW
ncbi:hypothetical protein HRR83_000981 [Exophiala dermatitidis]|uniref:Uncharacterized protein n=1 Tax=Exophiala dermatitidis TaxID=5970 RepID=A0AAN6F2C6_EXODE|nr:hypothetical protein HRR75_000893 [Exophiala dermatitidis]KAJ4528230.1 hypothetical protein HRR74_000985 [Exophiala dermatitidis]KAJ4528863.1 hypothetical protein HRR73_001486 [Exophiala dermatitidis]KAJ4530254.1 hypothetical protein HRR76_009482 [Exophiala dermatitidis]KAJ4553189.1 hypothetical protein HRR78_003448 [Exophiala dermatitidis]